VAAFYADENFPVGAVEPLRRLGHDVLTALDAGQANRAIPDVEVIEFATKLGRAVLTLNRWQFIGLHSRRPQHAGIVVCTQDPDVDRLAAAVDGVVRHAGSLSGRLLRVVRPG
jgi:Domain of unknown function (DUF5615)